MAILIAADGVMASTSCQTGHRGTVATGRVERLELKLNGDGQLRSLNEYSGEETHGTVLFVTGK